MRRRLSALVASGRPSTAPARRILRHLSTAAGRLPVLAEGDALARWRASCPAPMQASFLAGYSSLLGGIVTDPTLLMVPIDDHGFHRGHAVFDTCNVEGGRAFGLTMHIDRLLRSARQARIIGGDTAPPPSLAPEALRSTILQTIAATGRRDGVFVRYWLTAGRGDFGVSPARLTGGPCFFCVATEDHHSTAEPRGVSGATAAVPLKPPALAVMKSNNYLLNAVRAAAACASLPVHLSPLRTRARTRRSCALPSCAHGTAPARPGARLALGGAHLPQRRPPPLPPQRARAPLP